MTASRAYNLVLMLGLAMAQAACSSKGQGPAPQTGAGPGDGAPAKPLDAASALGADVLSVMVSGSLQNYTFAVTLKSPDLGCNQYADWWEVMSPDGVLIYRRILGHSHVDEQPFTRSGQPVAIDTAQEVIVRAHMNPGGYGGVAMRGSASAGFVVHELAPMAASELATGEPLPSGCAF